MAAGAYAIPGVPGVYRQARERVAELPRVRTDVAGFVGVGGPNRVGEAVQIDDWRGYELVYLRDALGHSITAPPGSMLAAAIRAFFANGGARCWVVNVATSVDAMDPEALLVAMLGVNARTGLEQLLVHPDVAIVGLPDLHAEVAEDELITRPLPPLADQGRFVCCPAIRGDGSSAATQRIVGRPLFDELQLEFAERYAIERCGRIKWRVFLVLAPPAGKTASEVVRWHDNITRNVDNTDCAALYWPWLRVQDKPGDPVVSRAPIGQVIGVFARRDLARGPHVAPANETLVDVVGLERPIDDPITEQVYDAGVDVIRGFPGHGIQIWGARTLAWDAEQMPALGWVNVRRCLSSIERNVERIGQAAVFEPNQPLLQLQVASAVTSHLLDVLAAGALQAEDQDEAFFVSCAPSNNPPSVLDAGQLICEIGVAIAAPAEFIVFRVGRREGVVELQEVP